VTPTQVDSSVEEAPAWKVVLAASITVIVLVAVLGIALSLTCATQAEVAAVATAAARAASFSSLMASMSRCKDANVKKERA
jgi:anti-sigma-K factor RskA